MKKADAIRIVTNCARTFHQELCAKHVLFIYQSGEGIEILEACFMQQNFLHLTGIKYSKSSKNFFRECCESKLTEDSISLDENGTTELKLRILPTIVNINRLARMIGNYNNSKALLVTDKLVGGIYGCVGFVLDGQVYIPNTALNEDIRNISRNSCNRILATFTKSVEDSKYSAITYSAKGVDVENLLSNDNIRNLVDIAKD